MKMRKTMYGATLIILGLSGLCWAGAAKESQATPTFDDGGNTIGGYAVTITTTTTLASSSGVTAVKRYRVRAFQDPSGYAVLVTTFTPATFATSPGWIITPSTGSWATSTQAAIYMTLDSAAGSGTALIRGEYELDSGDRP